MKGAARDSMPKEAEGTRIQAPGHNRKPRPSTHRRRNPCGGQRGPFFSAQINHLAFANGSAVAEIGNTPRCRFTGDEDSGDGSGSDQLLGRCATSDDPHSPPEEDVPHRARDVKNSALRLTSRVRELSRRGQTEEQKRPGSRDPASGARSGSRAGLLELAKAAAETIVRC